MRVPRVPASKAREKFAEILDEGFLPGEPN